MVPSLGNLDAYIGREPAADAHAGRGSRSRWPALREDGDIEAAGQLVLSHLRLVVSLSRQYLGYGLPQGDLIQEGNVGLMKAVKRFDPEQGVRLVSYALHWIKAEIHEYILKNWRMVKVATTKAQRKLFFNLRSMKQGLKGEGADGETHRSTLTPAEVEHRGARAERQAGRSGRDGNPPDRRRCGAGAAGDDDGEESYAPIAYLADDTHEPTRRWRRATATGWPATASAGAGRAGCAQPPHRRGALAEGQRRRSGGMTLHELAAEYGVSAERIRQIEVAAMKKMRKALEGA
jgi:RNA polymerase sigma-32 factor